MRIEIRPIENRTVDVCEPVGESTGGRRKEKLRHTFECLEVGQCFSVPVTDMSQKKRIAERLSSTRTNAMKTKKCRFSVRFEDGDKFTVYRVE